jgi:hypothetical protein
MSGRTRPAEITGKFLTWSELIFDLGFLIFDLRDQSFTEANEENEGAGN